MATDPKNATSPFGFVSGTNPMNNVRDRLNAIANSSTGDDPTGYSTTGSISEGDLIVTIGDPEESAIVIDSIQGTVKLDADVELIDTTFTTYDRNPSTGVANFSELGYSGFEIFKGTTGNKRASYEDNRIVFGDSTNDSFQTRITPSAIAATINISLPSESGQFALTSEIPTGGSGGTELIDEGDASGLVIAGRTAANYGNIGFGAVDLGFNSSPSTTIGATGEYSTVGGGGRNTASGIYSLIGGGRQNTASGTYSTVGGGRLNTASGDYYSTVSGGTESTASGTYSTVGGGFNNTASGYTSTVSGGGSNTASSTYSTVSGGYNTASGEYSTVSGGYNNTASGEGSTIVGGVDNNATGNHSTVGGLKNTAGGIGETIFGIQATTYTSGPGTTRLFAIGNGGLSTYSDAFQVYASGGIVLSPTTQPGETIEGMMYYDSATNKIKFYNGTVWVEIATV